MENVMELYYLLECIESNFENLYVEYKKDNLLDYRQLTAVKYNNIANLIMKIEREKYSSNSTYKYYIDKFYIINIPYYMPHTMISFPVVSSQCLQNLITIYYNDNRSVYGVHYSRYERDNLFSSNGIEILYRCCKPNILIIILSAQRKFSIKQRLPPEIYNFIYSEFLYGKFL